MKITFQRRKTIQRKELLEVKYQTHMEGKDKYLRNQKLMKLLFKKRSPKSLPRKMKKFEKL